MVAKGRRRYLSIWLWIKLYHFQTTNRQQQFKGKTIVVLRVLKSLLMLKILVTLLAKIVLCSKPHMPRDINLTKFCDSPNIIRTRRRTTAKLVSSCKTLLLILHGCYNNGFTGYEIEEGKYTISLNKNAHEVYDSFTFTVQRWYQIRSRSFHWQQS